MNLRGTGSLQELLGQSVVSSGKRKKRPRETQIDSSNDPSATAAGTNASSPLKPGHSRCPVCNKQLSSSDLDAFNLHLDKCLSKGKAQRSNQQSTLLHFSKKTSNSETTSPVIIIEESPVKQQRQPNQPASTPDSQLPSWPSQSDISSPSKSPHKRLSTPLSVQPPTCFACCVVGRKFQKSAAPLHVGQRLTIQPELNNPRDSNALLVICVASRDPVGHLPRAVAQHLGPLLRKQKPGITVEAVVTQIPCNDTSPAEIELQITHLASSITSPERLGAAIHRAKEAASNDNGSSRNTGQHLRHNFLTLIDTVCKEDEALLDADIELKFADAFRKLTEPSQCLFLRLWQRKGPLFRTATLQYAEVPDINAAVQELAKSHLVEILDESSNNRPWNDIASILTVPELQSVLLELQTLSGKGYSNAANLNRAHVLNALGSSSNKNNAALCRLLLEASGPVVALESTATTSAARLQRLFFLNEGQSLTQYLATDMGGLKYPDYKISRTRSVFTSRDHLLEYEIALNHAAQLTDALETGDLEAAHTVLHYAWTALDDNRHKDETLIETTPLFLRRFNAAWVYCMMATAGVSLLEKQKRYTEAVDRLNQLLGGWCYPSRRGEWWVRACTDLEHSNRPVASLELAESALADEWLSRGDRLALQRRILRLGKPPRRWKRPPWADEASYEPPEVRIVARPLNNTIGLKSRFYGLLDDEQCTVEELALQHYASVDGGGWQGVHSEGGIWATLFGLLMWDVLFSSVDDVFRTPFQTAPLDLDTDAFYPARQQLIESTLVDISSSADRAVAIIVQNWEKHHGRMCRGVSWDRWQLEELVVIAQCIGGNGLAAVCRLLAQDHNGWSGGMPDLLLWHPGRRQAKLSEVKGPRDRLSDQQRAWLAALYEGGLAVEVLKVVEPDDNNGKKKKKKR